MHEQLEMGIKWGLAQPKRRGIH